MIKKLGKGTIKLLILIMVFYFILLLVINLTEQQMNTQCQDFINQYCTCQDTSKFIVPNFTIEWGDYNANQNKS